MTIYTGDHNTRGKMSREEYMRELESGLDNVDQFDNIEDQGNLSVAEQLALKADAPKLRNDGRPVGFKDRVRPLNASQILFAQGVILGKSLKQAYRDAYPNAKGQDNSIASASYKLSRDPRVQRMIQDAWEQTVEVLVDDAVATKRYVMGQLVAHSKSAKQEGTKLKALELLGKSTGLFSDRVNAKDEVVSVEQLKRELSGHLKLLDNVKPIKVVNQS
jgi:hypothetical protein